MAITPAYTKERTELSGLYNELISCMEYGWIVDRADGYNIKCISTFAIVSVIVGSNTLKECVVNEYQNSVAGGRCRKLANCLNDTYKVDCVCLFCADF